MNARLNPDGTTTQLPAIECDCGCAAELAALRDGMRLAVIEHELESSVRDGLLSSAHKQVADILKMLLKATKRREPPVHHTAHPPEDDFGHPV